MTFEMNILDVNDSGCLDFLLGDNLQLKYRTYQRPVVDESSFDFHLNNSRSVAPGFIMTAEEITVDTTVGVSDASVLEEGPDEKSSKDDITEIRDDEQPPILSPSQHVDTSYDERSSENEIMFEPAMSREEDMMMMTSPMHTPVSSSKSNFADCNIDSDAKESKTTTNISDTTEVSSPSDNVKKNENNGKESSQAITPVKGVGVVVSRMPNKLIRASSINSKFSTKATSDSNKTNTDANKPTKRDNGEKVKTTKGLRPFTPTKVPVATSKNGNTSTEVVSKGSSSALGKAKAPSATTVTKQNIPKTSRPSVARTSSLSASPLPRVATMTKPKQTTAAQSIKVPKNPVLAERRANAAATSLPTSYKVSVTKSTSRSISPKVPTLSRKKEVVITKPRVIEKKETSPVDKTSVKTPSIKPSDWTATEKCKNADLWYEQRLKSAFEKGQITVMTSFLSKDVDDALQSLLNISKSQKVKLTVSDSFQRQKTAMCVLSESQSTSESAQDSAVNKVADRRSLKAMEAMLHGLPIVTSDWILHCQQEGRITIPSSSMYIRSLPTKSMAENVEASSTVSSSLSSDFGVAFLAGAMYTTAGKFKPLLSIKTVYLCGFSAVKQSEISTLLRDAGVSSVVLKALVAMEAIQGSIKKLSTQISRTPQEFIVLCNDSNVVIPPELEQMMKKCCSDSKVSGTFVIRVLNVLWLYDAITCGSCEVIDSTNECYRPLGGKGLELYNSLQRSTNPADVSNPAVAT